MRREIAALFGEWSGLDGEGATSRQERDLGTPLTALHRHQRGFAITSGDGQVTLVKKSLSAAQRIAVCDGAILAAAVDPQGRFIVCATDEGRVVRIDPTGELVDIWYGKGCWISDVKVGESGAIAWATGKLVHVAIGSDIRALAHKSVAAAIAFAPSSGRLAAAHQGGVSIWDLADLSQERKTLSWPGARVALSWSPDERFILTAMWDASLNAWVVEDGSAITMGRMLARPSQMTWSSDGNWLATSGYYNALLWPFAGSGPVDKGAEPRAFRLDLVSSVAFHPHSAVLAVGYMDGAVILTDIAGERETLVRPATRIPLSYLCWSNDGKRLAYGERDGVIGIANIEPDPRSFQRA